MGFSTHNELFTRIWTRWALGFFLVASLFGLSMRSFHVVEIPILEYRHLLHAHSHIALLGWGFMMLMGAMIFSLEDKGSYVKKYGLLFIALLISILGMLFSFPVQGYGTASITFSTLFVLLSYGFIAKLWHTLRQGTNTPGIRLIRWSLIGYLISTFGLWALGPVTTTLGRMHELYFMSIQWFLHFQLNGWFVLGTLGLLVFFAEKRGIQIPFSGIEEVILLGSVVLTFALVITWAEPTPVFFWINSLAVWLQAFAYFMLIRKIWRTIPLLYLSGLPLFLIRIAMISLIAKALLQALLTFPEVAVISYTIRMYVIGFLHLVLLGFMSLGLAGKAIAEGHLPNSISSKIGWTLVSIAFFGTEFLLFGQGTMVWLEWGYLSWYHFGLVVLSALFPFGLTLSFASLFAANYNLKQQFKQSSNPSQLNIQTMKKMMFWSLGIVAMILTSCSGGSESKTSSSKSNIPAAEAVAPTADPKGIGEFKSVDIGADVDASLAEKGKAIVDMKCTACHQLNDKRLVGPGFQGVTNRRRPEWIMNMITNVDVMLDQDPQAQKLLEECLTRMPNQNITADDARGILEYMRKNDEEKAGQRDAAIQ
ncbi:cytochrome c [Algoriphagus sp. CAU 1675]|uniref:c-type cytochrome n=1 Tax=Algoriphagus sp. CAU 1675 TaxID=3032597 RepID=UPI0023DCE1E6|nr:cytochrome c [Algoriphagus sp. CAU 1675]MDF2156492.1 cytochrome c [Algoriphagus sp. CAU 1675]